MQSIGLVLDRIREIETRMGALSDMVRNRQAELDGQSGEDFTSQVAKARNSLSTSLTSAPAGSRNSALASDRPYAGIVENASRESQVPAELLHAVVQRESNYNPRAVSPKGAMGLMQLMPGTAGDLQVSDPFDPESNVRGGAKYLRGLLDRFDGNLVKALAAYNAGPEAVKDGRIPDYPETKEYVKKVIDGYVRMSGLDPSRPSE